nr:immunoglobulin heavy chain junction region [Macaca mulatta]MOW75320.1 immunoglobulin heavy chain junction region [Macaca mulatta]MOW75328.1 immunoglobulin heavy chain junction region [Macaca mulatta]MOW75332.1 immunoglobulin heavy chain junction region [Macaca mulatta]MOW75771.1 immunoglobulin heavy chain junction region [Macaca mulatta]
CVRYSGATVYYFDHW